MGPNCHSPKLVHRVIVRGKTAHLPRHASNTTCETRSGCYLNWIAKFEELNVCFHSSGCWMDFQAKFGVLYRLFPKENKA